MSFEDFISEVEDASQYHYLHRGCGMGKILAYLENPDAIAVQTALERKDLTNSAIEKALKKRIDPALVPSSYTIGRHRRQMCKCNPEGF